MLMNRILYISIFIISLCTIGLYGQGTLYPLGSDAYHIYDRMEAKFGIPNMMHSSLKYYQRKDVVSFASYLYDNEDLSSLDKKDLLYLFRDSNDWFNEKDSISEDYNTYDKIFHSEYEQFYSIKDNGIQNFNSNKYIESKKSLLGHFYKTPANFYEYNHKDFYIKANPILNFQVGNSNAEEGLILLNQRGFELRGAIDQKIYFYSSFVESQGRFPDFVNQRIDSTLALPGAGFLKDFASSLFNFTGGYDYNLAQGYLGFNISKHVGIQLGHGRHFIGNGIRSLIISDFSKDYFYLKLNTRVGKFHYQNIFAELSAKSNIGLGGATLLPQKYIAAHHLSLNIGKRLNIGIFESVVFSRANNFEFQYLNPIIFYRTVEQGLGSPDNVLVGLDLKFNPVRNVSLYSQLIFDELLVKELFVERRGFWGNKFGIQVGAKVFDILGIDHLDGQVEVNLVRPYTYSHFDSTSTYSNFNQPLAHPLGANFDELIIKLRYQPIQKLVFEGRLLLYQQGEDQDGISYGANILISNNNRLSDFGNELKQGALSKVSIFNFDISYQISHNVYFDLQYYSRNKENVKPARNLDSNFIQAGLRINIGKYRYDY